MHSRIRGRRKSDSLHRACQEGDTNALNVFEPFVQLLQKHRIVEDFAIALAAWIVPARPGTADRRHRARRDLGLRDLLHKLELYGGKNPELFTFPAVEQFLEN